MEQKIDKNGIKISSTIKKILVRFKKNHLELSVNYQLIKSLDPDKSRANKITNQFMYCSFNLHSPINPVLHHFHMESPDLLKKLAHLLRKKFESTQFQKIREDKKKLFEHTITTLEKISLDESV